MGVHVVLLRHAFESGIGRARGVDCLDEGTAQRQHVKHETGAEN